MLSRFQKLELRVVAAWHRARRFESLDAEKWLIDCVIADSYFPFEESDYDPKEVARLRDQLYGVAHDMTT